MAASAYFAWLQKREFKAPRASSASWASGSDGRSLAASKNPAENGSTRAQNGSKASRDLPDKTHAVSAVETTSVGVRRVARPAKAGKRHQSSVLDPGEASGRQEQTTVAAREDGAKVAARQDTKVARKRGWMGDLDVEKDRKKLRNGREEVMKATALKLASASKVLRLSSAGRDVETKLWSGRVDAETKSAVNRSGDVDDVDKQLVTRKRTMENSRDSSTKRLRFGGDDEDKKGGGNEGGLPPKSPMKKQRIRTAMLDESQYWMSVDRFSHLT
ncbi:unnamed protein product [Phytophthora lilii]|uniref:Unnamed protein product n=1 Tax=Phytophthora lilii TaxID=2077276 RepID=A0A9W6X3Y2_9STRA|nr:unnamed protein product [Phytophthora lilii]